jgi:hypothetical protein
VEGLPKVRVHLDGRGETAKVELNGQVLHVLALNLQLDPGDRQKISITFYADVELVREGPVSALGRGRTEVP